VVSKELPVVPVPGAENSPPCSAALRVPGKRGGLRKKKSRTKDIKNEAYLNFIENQGQITGGCVVEEAANPGEHMF
jgi:hypothetical protein